MRGQAGRGPTLLPDQRPPCPRWGSLARRFEQTLTGSITVARAQPATLTVTAHDATASVQAHARVAEGTGEAFDATVQTINAHGIPSAAQVGDATAVRGPGSSGVTWWCRGRTRTIRGSGTGSSGSWWWADSSSGHGPPRMAAPDPSSRCWPRSWDRACAGRRQRRPGRLGTPARAWLTANSGTSTLSRRRRLSPPASHLVPISGTERGLHWTRILGPPCARSRKEGHDRSRKWPPVVRDVRDPDDDRRHPATSCTQVLRTRRPCSGARLPKVGMSRRSTQRPGDD
jgi:hypothetical protein